MPFIPAENVARCSMEINHNSVGCVNVFHVERDAAWNETTLTELGEDIAGWAQAAAHLATVSTSTSWRRVSMRDLTTESGLQVIFEGSGTVGTAGTAMPGSVSAVASLRTSLAGRSFRGRLYHVGLTESDVTENGLVAARRTALDTTYENLRTIINAVAERTFVVASFYTTIGGVPNQPRAAGLTTPITQVVVDSRVDTQRRRLDGTQFA